MVPKRLCGRKLGHWGVALKRTLGPMSLLSFLRQGLPVQSKLVWNLWLSASGSSGFRIPGSSPLRVLPFLFCLFASHNGANRSPPPPALIMMHNAATVPNEPGRVTVGGNLRNCHNQALPLEVVYVG